jgi:hypothetical protein
MRIQEWLPARDTQAIATYFVKYVNRPQRLFQTGFNHPFAPNLAEIAFAVAPRRNGPHGNRRTVLMRFGNGQGVLFPLFCPEFQERNSEQSC